MAHRAPQFERAIAATNLLPGPASTQLAIYCAWRLRGTRGALLGGLCFIAPGLVAILALAALFLSGSPPAWLRGAGMGAGAAVAAVAVRAGLGVAGPIWAGATRPPPRSRARLRARRRDRRRAGGTVARARPARVRRGRARPRTRWGARERATWLPPWPLLAAVVDPGGTLALVWTALKVGALAFGGGFVIVPLMQSDAVSTYHWMTHGQFLNAVALGQVTPGPVTQTVAVVGYAAGGLPGALLAAAVAFAPSFSFILLGAARFERLLVNERVLRVPRRRRAQRRRRDRRRGRAADGGARRELAVRGARRRGRSSARASPRRRADASAGRVRGRRGRPPRRADPALRASSRPLPAIAICHDWQVLSPHAKRIARAIVPAPLYRRYRRRRIASIIANYPTHDVTHVRGGHTLRIRLADPLAEGWYDRDATPAGVEFLREHGVLVPGAKVLDIGAHQGVVALVLARDVGETGHVVAVEADQHNARVAEANRDLNDAENLTVIHAAGAASEGSVSFSESLNGRVEGRDALVEVAALTVDGLASEYGTPDLVFIDVEGYEEQVLKGGTKTLENGSTTFMVEVHDHDALSAYGASADAIVEHFPAFDRYVSGNEREPFVPLEGPPPAGRFFLAAIPTTRR